MFRLYSSRSAERILQKYAEDIRRISARYGLPGPFIRAFLYQEITHIDLADLLVDLTVRLNWLLYPLRERSRGDSTGTMNRGRTLIGKLDSSTGYAQIFAFVGIDAVNFAAERGLTTYEALGIPGDHVLDPDRPADRRWMWRRLNRDRTFNLEVASLNLISAAEEVTGRIDFAGYSEEEIKRVFTRYNGTAKQISPYGEETYRHYLRYAEQEETVTEQREACR